MSQYIMSIRAILPESRTVKTKGPGAGGNIEHMLVELARVH